VEDMSGRKVHKFQRNVINREVYMIRKVLKEIFVEAIRYWMYRTTLGVAAEWAAKYRNQIEVKSFCGDKEQREV
jgi:hypothetical protein